jgi:integrase
VPLLGKKPLKDLTSADIRRFLEAVMSGKTAATVRTKPRGLARVTGGATAAVRAVGLLGGMLTYAKEMGYIEHNPAHGIRKPADKRRSFRLSSEEYRSLGQALEAAESRGEHWQAIAVTRLLAVTGCRRSEILNLKWSEVDLENSCLRLGDTKAGASIRPLPGPARTMLASLKREGDFVFPGVRRDDGSYASVFPKTWRRIVEDRYSPHGLRHAYASATHELGFGELTIKALLGHARVGVTSGYVATVDSYLLAAAEKVARYIVGAITGETGLRVEKGRESLPSYEAEPDAIFNEREWDEVARSIPLKKLPEEMKQAIAEAVGVYVLTSSEPPKVRKALTKLARLLSTLCNKLSTLRDDLMPETIVDQVEELIDQADVLQQAAQLELERRSKKGGRPPQIDRHDLVERLLWAYALSGKPVRLSRNSAGRPSGPCYRFISTILKLKQISIKGIEHIIEESRDMPKTLR